MKIKNIGNKIVGIGNITIIPDATETIADTCRNNPVVQFLAKSKKIKIMEEAETSDNEPEAKKPSPYKGMKKEDLIKLAAERGIEVTDSDTIKTLTDKLTNYDESGE